MRTRDLKPGFFQSDELAEVSRDARLFFAGLWTLADREGRLECRPKKIKALLFPYDDDITAITITAMIESLSNARGKFIRVYEVDSNQYIEITKFKENQHIHPNEKASAIPAPVNSGTVPEITRQEMKLKKQTGNYASSSVPSGSLCLPESVPSSSPSTRACDPCATEKAAPTNNPDVEIKPRHMVARHWCTAFGAAWCSKFGKVAYGAGEADARACGRLDDTLDGLDPGDVLEAWNRREDVFAEYLDTDDRAAQRAGYTFPFFASNFLAYMIPKEKRPAQTKPGAKVPGSVPEQW